MKLLHIVLVIGLFCLGQPPCEAQDAASSEAIAPPLTGQTPAAVSDGTSAANKDPSGPAKPDEASDSAIPAEGRPVLPSLPATAVEQAAGTLPPTYADPSQPKTFPATPGTAPQSVSAVPAAPSFQVFPLQRSHASGMHNIIMQLFPSVTAVADDRTNCLIVRTDAEQLAKIEELITVLEQNPVEEKKAIPPAGMKPSPKPTASEDPFGSPRYTGVMGGTTRTIEQLRQDYATADKRSQEVAARLRSDQLKSPPGERERGRARYELREVVAEAFQLRQQLHRAELAEFAQRISRVRQLIATRDRLRDQIVDRRVDELLDPNLQWDVPGMAASPAPAARVSQAPKPQSSTHMASPSAAKAAARGPAVRPTFVNFEVETPNVKLDWIEGQGVVQRIPALGMYSIQTLPGETVKLRLSQVPDRSGFGAFVVITCATDTERANQFLVHNSLPLSFTEEDLDQVAANQSVTKVIYLPKELDAAGGSLTQTIASSRLDPEVDPVMEAKRRGSVLAVYWIGSSAKDVFGRVPREDAATFNTVVQLADRLNAHLGAAASQSLAANTQRSRDESPASTSLLLHSVQDIRTRLTEHARRVAQAQEKIARVESDINAAQNPTAARQTAASILAQFQAELEQAKQAQRLAQDEYAAQLKLLELQCKNAEAAVESLREEHATKKSAYESGTVSPTEVTKAERAVAEADFRLQSARTVLDLYRKIGENLPASPKPE